MNCIFNTHKNIKVTETVVPFPLDFHYEICCFFSYILCALPVRIKNSDVYPKNV